MFEWDHSIRVNHILRFPEGQWAFADGEATIAKEGRRIYVDGPILACQADWTFMAYVQVQQQTMAMQPDGSWQTIVKVKLLSFLSPVLSRLLSAHNAEAQRAAGNKAASWPPRRT